MTIEARQSNVGALSAPTLTDDRFELARAAWPGVDLPRDIFERWMAARGGAGNDEARIRELYLACACAHGDGRALAAFEQSYWGSVARAVSRFEVNLEDLRQELHERLFVATAARRAKIAEYDGRGGLDRWVRAAAVRVALNATRSKKNQAHRTLADDDFLWGPDPAVEHLKEKYRAEFKRAFSAALDELEPELQTYLRMYYLDGVKLQGLAKLFDVSEPTASRRLAKGREQLLTLTRQRLGDRLKVGSDELESIMRLIESRLSVTFGQP